MGAKIGRHFKIYHRDARLSFDPRGRERTLTEILDDGFFNTFVIVRPAPAAEQPVLYRARPRHHWSTSEDGLHTDFWLREGSNCMTSSLYRQGLHCTWEF